MSHGLLSEPHEYLQAVFPHPPRNLTVRPVTSNSVHLAWEPPSDTIFSEYIVK